MVNLESSFAPLALLIPDGYDPGFVACETCGTGNSFLDGSNAFMTKLLAAHRLTWLVSFAFSHP